MLRILTIYRRQSMSPDSEWWLHRHWFSTTALDDLFGVDVRVVPSAAPAAAPGT